MLVSEAKIKYRKIWEEIDRDIDTDCTCNTCYPNDDDLVTCTWAFDIYNSDDDCLGSK